MQNKEKDVYLYRQFFTGDYNFGFLEKEMKLRRIKLEYLPMRRGGRLYRVSVDQARDLPKDGGEPYLGDQYSGYSLYPLREKALQLVCEKYALPDAQWIKVND